MTDQMLKVLSAAFVASLLKVSHGLYGQIWTESCFVHKCYDFSNSYSASELGKLVRPAGLEPTTVGLEDCYSALSIFKALIFAIPITL